MSNHPLIEMWMSTISASKANIPVYPSQDHFKQGIDYLSLVSEPIFDDFLRETTRSSSIHSVLGFSDVRGWMTSTDSNKPSSALRIKDIPKGIDPKFPIFLDQIRRAIWRSISDVVLNAHQHSRIPESNTILYFTDGLRWAYLVSYHMHYDKPVIEIMDRVANPRGIFDLDGIMSFDSHRVRNRAKNYLTSGHKLVMQRGVLTHVDRRNDRHVFGPTIDTVVLSEIIGRIEKKSKISSFLEIGSGNGHISATAASFLSNVKNFVAFDVNGHATTCTVRNIEHNMRYFHKCGTERYNLFCGICGAFRDNVFRTTFDLVVANPPYVERTKKIEDFKERFTEAVAGTELIKIILESLPRLLSDQGRLLLMASSASADAVETGLPKNFQARPALWTDESEFEVPFDVEDVLDQEDWLADLIKAGAVRQNGAVYTHVLKPLWIERKS